MMMMMMSIMMMIIIYNDGDDDDDDDENNDVIIHGNDNDCLIITILKNKINGNNILAQIRNRNSFHLYNVPNYDLFTRFPAIIIHEACMQRSVMNGQIMQPPLLGYLSKRHEMTVTDCAVFHPEGVEKCSRCNSSCSCLYVGFAE